MVCSVCSATKRLLDRFAGVLLLGLIFNILNFENGLGWISLSAYWQSVIRGAFLLLVVWWAWIYTTWMANWFDPSSPAVRGVLVIAEGGGNPVTVQEIQEAVMALFQVGANKIKVVKMK